MKLIIEKVRDLFMSNNYNIWMGKFAEDDSGPEAEQRVEKNRFRHLTDTGACEQRERSAVSK